MINLKEIQPDYTGTWYQESQSGDFQIYILDIQNNNFFGVVTDCHGIAEIEGTFFQNQTLFIKTYARYVTKSTKASTLPIVYIFEFNIFDIDTLSEKTGLWHFPAIIGLNQVTIKLISNLKVKTDKIFIDKEDEKENF